MIKVVPGKKVDPTRLLGLSREERRAVRLASMHPSMQTKNLQMQQKVPHYMLGGSILIKWLLESAGRGRHRGFESTCGEECSREEVVAGTEIPKADEHDQGRVLLFEALL